MAITVRREVARADMDDEFGVSVWQERKLVHYTTQDARKLAVEIFRAAEEADGVAAEDQKAEAHVVDLLRDAGRQVIL